MRTPLAGDALAGKLVALAKKRSFSIGILTGMNDPSVGVGTNNSAVSRNTGLHWVLKQLPEALLPPMISTVPSFSWTAAWPHRAVLILPTAVKLSFAGLYNSAVLRALKLMSNPPVYKMRPSFSGVAVKKLHRFGDVIGPIGMKLPLPDPLLTYRSALPSH